MFDTSKEPLSLSNVESVAEATIALIKENEATTIGYDKEGIGVIDRLIAAFKDEGATAEMMPQTMLGFGCYIGEVIKRHYDGQWVETKNTAMAALWHWPLCVRVNETLCNPLGKVIRRLDDGEENNLVYYFETLSQSPFQSD